MKRTLLSIGALSLLLFAIDRLYRWLHPEVDLVRASLVGLTALCALALLAFSSRRPGDPWSGALAIFVSAAGSVLLIEAGVLSSRSLVSGIVHVGILAAAFPLIEQQRGRATARARRSAAPGGRR